MLGFVVQEPCPRLTCNGFEAPSSYMGFLGRVRHFTMWLKEIGTGNGKQEWRNSGALSERGAAFGPIPPAAISAQDHFIWILCRIWVPEQLFLTIEAWEAAVFLILEEKHLEHYMIIGAMTGSCVALCTQMSMLSSSERSNCILFQMAMDTQIAWHKEEQFQLERLKTIPFP